jgi:hypothetical protein
LRTLYPFTASGLLVDGVNLSAIGLVLLIVAIPILWFRALNNTFLHPKPREGYVLPDVYLPTAQGDAYGEGLLFSDMPQGSITDLDRTPTARPDGLPTSTPTVVPTPRPLHEVLASPTARPTATPAGVYTGGYGNVPIDIHTYPGGSVYASLSQLPGEEMTAVISYYYPPYGGINCAGSCDTMANGAFWADWIGRAAACPASWPFGTSVYIFGRSWICMDRGGAIVENDDGSVWIDLLSPVMPYGLPYAARVQVKVNFPDGQ